MSDIYNAILAIEQSGTISYLLAKGCDPNAQDRSSNTALMGVCFKGF